ncbi:MAG: hypothetical protein HN392_03450 [Anaerolineae bacterium]|jgi:hypothetical protein|nr:hypothetical protein [Anaerolineae bacterium]MBT7074738.1 hypothetical protein [Anaerolineae bacterium]MBT7783625.1 hypothetical protein [Anaerolineae bacterium]
MKKIVLLVALFMLGLNACTSSTEQIQATETVIIEPTLIIVDETAIPPAYFPLPSDSRLTKARAIIDSSSLLFTTGDPVELELILKGHLPTPCHELRVQIPEPDVDGNVMVEVYSLTEPDILCEQVLRAFNERIILGTYPRGSYLVWINGGVVGNFDF